MSHEPLPEHLVEAWGHLMVDPRDNPRFCIRQSQKTPSIPWHNGWPTCISCGRSTKGAR